MKSTMLAYLDFFPYFTIEAVKQLPGNESTAAGTIQTALNAILTEITYPVSAVTLKQTRVFENKLGTFTYRHIKAHLYQGFTFSEYGGIPFAQATVAKALFDTLYFRSWRGGRRLASYNLAEDLRLNLDDFSAKDQDEFATFVEISQSKKMNRILKNLRKTVWRP